MVIIEKYFLKWILILIARGGNDLVDFWAVTEAVTKVLT